MSMGNGSGVNYNKQIVGSTVLHFWRFGSFNRMNSSMATADMNSTIEHYASYHRKLPPHSNTNAKNHPNSNWISSSVKSNKSKDKKNGNNNDNNNNDHGDDESNANIDFIFYFVFFLKNV